MVKRRNWKQLLFSFLWHKLYFIAINKRSKLQSVTSKIYKTIGHFYKHLFITMLHNINVMFHCIQIYNHFLHIPWRQKLYRRYLHLSNRDIYIVYSTVYKHNLFNRNTHFGSKLVSSFQFYANAMQLKFLINELEGK